ncbi:MAG TPA: cell envelope integrity protein TolA [Acidiferrobacteraceae bacterium]|nr:cell envelope integrity protein TolA [Acidiferrobacteraceae bacterium]
MSEGYGRAFIYAILVHVLVLLVLGISFDWQLIPSNNHQIDDKKVVQATLVDEGKVQKELDRIKKKEAARKSAAKKEKARLKELVRQAALAEKKAEKKRKAKARRLVELKKKQALDKKKKALEKKRKTLEARKPAERKKKKLTKKKKREQIEKKRKAHANKLTAQRKRRQAEKALQALLRKEQLQRQAQGELNRYEPLIRQRVERFWIRPPGAKTGLKAVLRVRLTPSGEVLTVRVVQSSGNAIFDRSVENAVKKATPLPLPSNPELAEFFSVIDFEFDPQKG